MKNRFVAVLCATASIYVLAAAYAQAANVTVTDGQTLTASQTVGTGETGTVDAGGTIATTGDDEWALLANGDNVTLINNGTITTAGNFAFSPASGLYVLGNNNAATNNGSIATTGEDGIAILAIGANYSVVNNGTIATTGARAHGIQANIDGSSIVNNGTIEVDGTGAKGFTLSGTNGTVINNGSITTNGNTSAYGMEISLDTNLTVVNNGTVTTTGSNIDGVYLNSSTGGGTVFTNNGTITSTGDGIRSQSDDITIVSNGTINDGSGVAINIVGDDNTVVIRSFSDLDGSVDFNGTGGVLQYDLSSAGGGIVTLLTDVNGTHATETLLSSGAKTAQSGNTVVAVTPNQFASTSQVVSQTLTDTGTVLNNRQQLALLGDTTEVAEGRQYAASTTSMNDATSPNEWAVRDRTVAWAEAFGSYQNRGKHDDSSESKARSGGALAGVDLPQSSSGYRAGFYAGGFGGDLTVGDPTFREIESTGGMAGGYIGRSYDAYYVSLGLGLGFSNNDSTRATGVDTAVADYTSYFASPSLTVMRPLKGDGVTWVPSVTVRYTAQHDDGYTETGSALANQTVDARTTHSLDGRAMVDARLDATNLWGGMLKPSFRAGVQGETLIGSNDVDVTVLGTELSFDPQGADGSIDGVVGTNLNYAIDQQLDVYFDGEANLGLNHGGPKQNNGIVGRVGARWKM